MKLITHPAIPLFAVLASATALAQDPPQDPANTPSTSITVTDTRATFTVPEGAVARPGKPDLTLKLPQYNLNSVDYNFPSGLRMIFQSDHSQPVVSVTTIYDRGSTADPIGKEGIAHFVEHLWFRSQHVDQSDATGEKRLPKVWDILSDLGCSLNASTADDWTNYMSVCPSTSLPALMRLESLRMGRAVEGVEASVVDTEREVIRNELRMRYENSWAQVLPYLFEKLYPDGHPYARLGIGSHESLKNVELIDIQTFVTTNYVPENTTIVVVGDFELEDVPALIFDSFDPTLLHPGIKEEHLRRVPRRGIEKPDPNNAAHWMVVPMDPGDPTKPLQLKDEAPKRVTGAATEPPEPKDRTMGRHRYAGEDPMVVIAWSVPGAYRGDDWVLRLMANTASGYIQQYFYGADLPVNWRETGCFLWDSKVDSKVMCAIPLTTTDVNPDQIAERAADQIAFMWDADYNFDPNNNVRYIDMQLSRFRMEMLAGILRSLDLFATVGGGRATDISHWAHFTGSHQYHSDAMNEIMTVKGQQISEAAFKYLRRDRMVKVFLEPIPKDELVADAAQSSEYHGAQGGDDVVRTTIDPKQITAEVIKDFTITPNVDLLIDKTLPNGLRVVVLEHGEAPLVQAGLLFYGGSATATPQAMDGFAEDYMSTTWNDPTRKSDPLRIAGTWETTRSSNYTYHSLSASNGNLDGALWLMRDAMEEIRADMDGRTDDQKTAQGRLKKDWKYRDGYYNSGFVTEHRMQQVNPGHPLAAQADWERYETQKSWGSSDVMTYVRQKYQPANATLLIVGNVNGEQAAKLAEYYFQGWSPSSSTTVGQMPDVAPPNAATAAPRIVLYDDPGKTQTNVGFACPTATASQDDDAIRHVLSDYLDEETWIILRENGGVTYGAYAYSPAYPGGSAYLNMGSLVQNDGTVLAIKTFQELAKKAEAGDFDTDTIQKHKLNRAKRYVLAQQSVPQMAGRLLDQLYWRNDWAMVTGYAERLAAVDAAAMQAQMGECSKHYIIQVEGPVDTLKPVLDEAGIAYEVFDWKQAGKDRLAKYDPKAFKKSEKAAAKAKAKEEKEGTTASSDAP